MTTRRQWMYAEDVSLDTLEAIIDTREQQPFDLSPMRSRVAKLETGDYSLVGLTDKVAIERKSLQDLIGCCGRGRERFERELQRLKGFELQCVIVECDYGDLEAGGWRSSLTPNQVTASVNSWVAGGNPFYFAGDTRHASAICRQLLWYYAKRRLRELRCLATIESQQ